MEEEVKDGNLEQTEITQTQDDATNQETTTQETDASTSKQVQPDTFDVTIDGQVQKVTRDELVKGYLRESDYTRKTQEIAELKRKAEYADRLMADPRYQTRPTDPYVSAKQRFMEKIKGEFGDVNPKFLELMFDAQAEIAGMKAQESVQPINNQSAEQFEREFLKAHPDVQRGTQQYNEIADLIGKGVDPDKAYELAFKDVLMSKKIEEAIKLRDEDAKRKLKQTKTSPATSKTAGSRTFDDVFDEKWAKHGAGV